VDLRRGLLLFAVLCILTTAVKAESPADTAGGVADVEYSDLYGLFQLMIPSGWIYQAGESSACLLVFYGPEHEQLLYIEYFPELTFTDPMEFAASVLNHYGAAYGLNGFELISGPTLIDLAGLKAAQVEYNYVGKKEWTECRIFAIIDQMGLTITFSEASEYYSDSKAQFDSILASLSWEVSK